MHFLQYILYSICIGWFAPVYAPRVATPLTSRRAESEKGTNGVSTNGVTAIVLCFVKKSFDRGPFWYSR